MVLDDDDEEGEGEEEVDSDRFQLKTAGFLRSLLYLLFVSLKTNHDDLILLERSIIKFWETKEPLFIMVSEFIYSLLNKK